MKSDKEAVKTINKGEKGKERDLAWEREERREKREIVGANEQ